ncbi:hypothetical protein GCM10020219_018560 [Nonomuraea dietziae]
MSRAFCVLLGAAALSGCAGAPVETDVLHRAEQILIGSCMARQNLKYWPQPKSWTPDMDLFPYVVDDVEWARENGYGRTRRQELGKTAAPSEKYFRALPEDRRRAWLTTFHGDRAAALEAELPIGGTVGHSANGCAAQAWQELYGDKGRWFKASRVIQTLGNMRIGQTQADPAYRAALKRWSECMSRTGFSAATPLALRKQLLAQQGADAESNDKKAATAEARCAMETGLSKTARDLDAANAEALKKRYPEEFENAARLRESALPKARALVSEQKKGNLT